MEKEKEFAEFYLAIDEGKDVIIYRSEKFALTTIDLINLIKICLVQRRAVDLGKKILAVFLDTEKDKKRTYEILNNIGLKIQEDKPDTIKKTKNR
jgi:hypothetical protein